MADARGKAGGAKSPSGGGIIEIAVPEDVTLSVALYEGVIQFVEKLVPLFGGTISLTFYGTAVDEWERRQRQAGVDRAG